MKTKFGVFDMKKWNRYIILILFLFIYIINIACTKRNSEILNDDFDNIYDNELVNDSKIYDKAIMLYNEHKKAQARFFFSKIKNYSESRKYLDRIDLELCNKSMSFEMLLSINGNLILPYSLDIKYSCLHKNEEKEPNDAGEYPVEQSLTCNKYKRLTNLTGVVSLCNDDIVIPLFLMTDGSVKSVYCYENIHNKTLSEVVENNIKNIIQIAGDGEKLAFLTADGKIIDANGENIFNESNYKAVGVAFSHIVGLKTNGTISVYCENKDRADEYKCFCDTSEWKNISMIKITGAYIYGVTEDGRVFATCGKPSETKFIELNQYLSSLKNLCYINTSLNGENIFFMKIDGVWIRKSLDMLKPEVKIDGWSDVIDIYSVNDYTLGLTNKGSIIGYENTSWAAKADELNNIMIP